MAIFLEPLKGKNLATGSIDVFRRYKIIDRDVEGQCLLGYVDWDTNNIMFTVKVDPMSEAKFRSQIAKILDREEALMNSIVVPERPESYSTPIEEEKYDEFDESDLT
jgi:aspartokinase